MANGQMAKGQRGVGESCRGFAVLVCWWGGVGFVVELDDELGLERGGVAEDEVDGFAVDFVLVGLTLGDAGSAIDEFAELDLGEVERRGRREQRDGGMSWYKSSNRPV